MKTNPFTTAIAILGLGCMVAATTTPADAKPVFPHPHFHHHGFGLAAGILGSMALGAAMARASYAPSCSYVSKRVYDNHGYFVGYQNVEVCE